jgi:hypothetical protein
MSHREDSLVYLPSGFEVDTRLLERVHPSWFAEIENVRTLFASNCKTWGFCAHDMHRLQKWCAQMMRQHSGTSKEYWLAVCLVGTARKHSLDPMALVEIFESVAQSYRSLFDKNVRLPQMWELRASVV